MQSDVTLKQLNILLVEDDEPQRKLLTAILQNTGLQVTDVASCEEAILFLKSNTIDVIFSDWKLPTLSGLALLQYVRCHFPHLGFVMATAHGTIGHAVEAMQAGADDYLAKPFQRQELLLSIEKAARAFHLRQQNNALNDALGNQQKLIEFVGNSQALEKVQARIRKVANTDASVLISGESGTGKELAAKALHKLSSRHTFRFVAINCGAIPADIAEAELFGAKKGAYTGAHSDKQGKFSYANNGTLFLDEIAELPALLQTKLLRFLQEGTVTPLGSNDELQLNVRIVAASHQNLQQMVEKGQFREDLFYRLNIVPLEIPALRERPEDIPLLTEFFLNQCCQRYNESKVPISSQTMQAMLAYSWPGNVRELSNRVERYVLLHDESELYGDTKIRNESCEQGFLLAPEGLDFEALEASLLKQSLVLSRDNKTKAAKLLTLNYKAFLYRLDKYGLS
jgi:two-component system NtrC family response regulator